MDDIIRMRNIRGGGELDERDYKRNDFISRKASQKG